MCEDADQDIDDMKIMPGTLFVCPARIAGQAIFGENLCPARNYARHAFCFFKYRGGGECIGPGVGSGLQGL